MKRLLTAAAGIPIVILIVWYPSARLLAALLAVLTFLALEEFFGLTSRLGLPRPPRWFSAAAASTLLIGDPASLGFELAILACLLLSASIAAPSPTVGSGWFVSGTAGCVYICGTLSLLAALPRELILMLLAIIWTGDSLAFYGGRMLGRTPLAPVVSPKKTVEGAVAGLAGSVGAGLACAWFLDVNGSVYWIAAICAATAVAGQAGDLAESVLKRGVHVKDSSSLLPGHGGVLDRLDSLFLAIPVFYGLIRL